MPSTSPGRGGPALALPAVLALVLVVASVGAVAGGGPTPGADPAAVSDEARTATPVNQSNGLNLTLLVGPESVSADLDGYETLRAARDGPVLEQSSRLQRGETLILAFRSPRLNRSYAAAEATGTTPRFFESVNRSNATVSVTGPTGPSCEPLRIRLQQSRTRALVQADGPAFAVALDTGAVATEGGCASGLEVPGEYQATVEIPTEDGRQRATAEFELLQRPGATVDDTRVRRGRPSLAPTLDTAAAIRRADRNGTLVSSTRAVGQEVVVMSFQSDWLHRTYVNTSGPNATARLSTAVETTGGDLSLAVPRGSTDGGSVVLSGPGVRTLHDSRNATFHLVLDTDRARIRRGNETRPLTPEREVELRLRVPRPDVDAQRFRAQVFLQEPAGQVQVARNQSSLSPGGAEVAVIGAGEQFVARGETNLAPGWNLTLRVRGPNGTLLATRQGRSTADAGSRAGSTYRLDEDALSDGDRFEVSLHAAGESVDRVPVLVGPRPMLRNATARRVAAGPDGPTVRFAVTAHYPAPGFVVVRNGSELTGFRVPADEPTRVRGTLQLRPRDDGEARTVRLIAVYDSNHNGEFDPPGEEMVDPPFESGDGGLLAARVELDPPTPTPTVTAPPPGTTIPMTGSDGQPGFGPLAAVVAGLAVVAVTAGRRRLRDSG
jgi:hypothetical protein